MNVKHKTSYAYQSIYLHNILICNVFSHIYYLILLSYDELIELFEILEKSRFLNSCVLVNDWGGGGSIISNVLLFSFLY